MLLTNCRDVAIRSSSPPWELPTGGHGSSPHAQTKHVKKPWSCAKHKKLTAGIRGRMLQPAEWTSNTSVMYFVRVLPIQYLKVRYPKCITSPAAAATRLVVILEQLLFGHSHDVIDPSAHGPEYIDSAPGQLVPVLLLQSHQMLGFDVLCTFTHKSHKVRPRKGMNPSLSPKVWEHQQNTQHTEELRTHCCCLKCSHQRYYILLTCRSPLCWYLMCLRVWIQQLPRVNDHKKWVTIMHWCK